MKLFLFFFLLNNRGFQHCCCCSQCVVVGFRLFCSAFCLFYRGVCSPACSKSNFSSVRSQSVWTWCSSACQGIQYIATLLSCALKHDYSFNSANHSTKSVLPHSDPYPVAGLHTSWKATGSLKLCYCVAFISFERLLGGNEKDGDIYITVFLAREVCHLDLRLQKLHFLEVGEQ